MECSFQCCCPAAVQWLPSLEPEHFPARLQEAEVTKTQEAQSWPNMPLVAMLGCMFP